MDERDGRSGSCRRHTRRELLAAGSGAVVGLAGCSLVPGGSGFLLEWGDGASTCVSPIERAESPGAFYGYDPRRGRAEPRNYWEPGLTVTFLYRDTSSGDLSLCVVNGAPYSDSYGDGRAIITFEGLGGATWQARDDPVADSDGGDTYHRPDRTLADPATVVWRWPGDETDGGMIGPLEEPLDVSLTHSATGEVAGRRVGRDGLSLWLFLDGADPSTRIEVARFERGGDLDASIRLSTC